MRAKPAESTTPDRLLLPIREFSRTMGISVWTARAWAYSGRIASVKLGARLQVPVSEVDRLIAEGMRPRVQEANGRQ
jgi:predicted site-specific integrase-resolvase